MSRVPLMKSRVGKMAPRIGHATGDERGRDRQRSNELPWRGWYNTKRWADLRLEVFTRDGLICQRTGELCFGQGNEPNAPVANHRRPHHGDPALFWDPANIETVAKHVHDGLIQREERAAALKE